MPNKAMYRIDRFYNTTTLGVIQLKHISNRMIQRKKGPLDECHASNLKAFVGRTPYSIITIYTKALAAMSDR